MSKDKIKIIRDYEGFVCKVADVEIDLNVIPTNQLKSLAAYGLRKVNDAINSDADVTDKIAAANEMTHDIIADRMTWTGKSGIGAETKLAEAERALGEYNAMSEEQQAMVAKLGITKASMEKAVQAARKAVERKNSK